MSACVAHKSSEICESAAAAGCQILCEKPIATSLADAETMRTVCEKNGVRFMTAFPMRFAPSARAVRALINEGGAWRHTWNKRYQPQRDPQAHRCWFADRALAGGGSVMDHTVHLADLFRWYFGAEVEEVYAEVDNLFAPERIAVDTAGLMLMTLSHGVQASIDCSCKCAKTGPWTDKLFI